MVPVVMGAREEDYKRLAPPNSYIHVSNFTSAKRLAQYLQYLDRNHTAYTTYHDWRSTYVKGNKGLSQLCQLCQMAHQTMPRKQYNISQYFSRERMCKW